MIEYEESAGAVVRCVESDVAGRRVAAYATPCSGEVGGPAFRFDPLERRLVARRPSGRVSVGPWDPDAWARAFSRCPPGPVLVGPGSPVDEIRGSCQAAAEGAFRSGRGVYLCDPEPSGLPEAARGALVALCIWAPGDEDWERRLAPPLAHGIPSGAVLPVLPGWTDEREFLGEWFTRVISAGAQFTAALAASGGGDERRLLVEARARVDPGSADRFFEKIHHCDWTAAVREGLARFRAEAARRGLSTIPPRPMGPAEPPGNSAAAARLEEQAVEVEEDEHRSSLLLAAARWIDESGRDLTPVVREGNFGKVFPFGALAREAEAAFRVERS
ncbi:MAG TPA: hypothetical protein VFW15_12545 [Thermoanaerobaculia bacterium]|nr:hypothetical protein [Thermoanaerobaculia bacterium]